MCSSCLLRSLLPLQLQALPFSFFVSSWEPLKDQVFSENDAFSAWTFVKRRPLWQTLLSFVWPVVTLAICLFPVYPHWCKLLILYSCPGVLLLFFLSTSLKVLNFWSFVFSLKYY